jgi:hypothetical protein
MRDKRPGILFQDLLNRCRQAGSALATEVAIAANDNYVMLFGSIIHQFNRITLQNHNIALDATCCTVL